MARRSETVGERIRRYRADKGITAAELAERAGVSKSYLSELETAAAQEARRGPSADVLYRIAKALGVAMSDLLGRPVITAPTTKRPASLANFARKHRLPAGDVEMLASIQFRGEPPASEERWSFIYQAIRGSEALDAQRRRSSKRKT